jgi:aspartate carbamoyltransferase catalytic subunit
MSDSSSLSQRSLLGIRGLTCADLDLIHSTAREFKDVLNRPIKKVPSLRDFTVANLFFENSTRTRLSFELAEKRLSADVVNFSAAGSSVKKGETLVDTVNNILAMKVDMVVMRHPHPGAHHFLASKVDVPIVNAGDGTHEHPTQALLDTFSLRQSLGEDLTGRNIAIVGDIQHSRVALSNIWALKLLGANVRVCGPHTLIPKHLSKLGVEVSHDLDDTIRWADALNMLRIQLERQGSEDSVRFFPTIREYTMRYGLTLERLGQSSKSLTIMHPGPINRGVEISSEVADSEHSIILEQVENGVAVRMAVLYLLAQKRG